MYVQGTEQGPRVRRRSAGRRGSALLAVMVVSMGLFGIVYFTTAVAVEEAGTTRRTFDDLRAEYLAEAGVARAQNILSRAASKNPMNPLEGVTSILEGGVTKTLFLGEPVLEGAASVGAYSVTLTTTMVTAASVVVRIDATGYVPDAPANLAPGERLISWKAISATYEYALERSEVFDYGYFINNWGWFYGNTINCRGNARSNGQFDAAGYTPTVTGQPRYDDMTWMGSSAQLVGYNDDNGDGLEDGNDGGVFSGWDIVGAQNLQGNGGLSANQHEFDDQLPMPNLSDLSAYEAQAISKSNSIKVGGTTMTDAVFGDDAGETGNLFLYGTAANPIVLDGSIVARGDVIISGFVTGQGAIYAGGNIYVPDSVTYVDPPSTTRPADNTQAATEAWLSANDSRDFLGLFANENIVVGDHTNSTWRHYVGGWMSSSLNKSDEDAGEDGIPNTTNGRDGIANTADDDVLEDDNVFSVETYSAADAALGLIPPGFVEGDVIPGSGEDIDGDGIYDGQTTLADLDFSVALDTANWGGNMPAGGIASYSSIATLYANNLDAVFYTNHSFCYTVLGGSPAKINGALVSRNENVVYGTPSLDINYDCRLLGGNAGVAGDLLPKTLKAAQLVRWMQLDADPNRYAVAP